MKLQKFLSTAITAAAFAIAGLITIPGSAADASDQTLVIASGIDGNSFDPAEAVSFEAIKFNDWMFDGLVRYDGDTLKIAPALATSWSTSEDGMTWTFHLRKGVKFQDGTDFNADAVIFSFERQMDPKHPYYRNTFVRWPAKFSAVKQVVKVDDYTVKLVLSAPSPALLPNLARYVGYIVSPTAIKKDPDGFRKHPVGTGPFKFVRYVQDNFTELARNEDYWNGPAKVARLVVRTIPDNNVRLLALKNNEIQLAYGIGFAQFAQVKADPNLKVVSSTPLGISLMVMNTETKPFDDVKVRKAVNYAINKDRFFDTVFSGLGTKANQLIPEGWMGHVDDGVTYDYDVEKAKQLLTEAGYEDGFNIQLITWTTPRPFMPSPRDAAALIKSDLANVGINVEIQTMTWEQYIQVRNKGDFGAAISGFISGTLDPDGMMYPLYGSKFIRARDTINWSRWRNAEADTMLEQAGRTYDEAKRTDLYQKVSRIIMDQAPSAFLAHPVNLLVARKNLEGVFVHPSNWVPLQNATLAK